MQLLHQARMEPELRLLVVEDDDEDAEILRYALERASGHMSAWRVSTVEAALRFLKRQPPFEDVPRPHVVITDLSLPDASGFDLLLQLLGGEPYAGVPVVVMSNSWKPYDVDSAYRMGAAMYIVKPMTLEHLARVMEHLEFFFLHIVTLLNEDGSVRAPTRSALIPPGVREGEIIRGYWPVEGASRVAVRDPEED